MRNFFRHSRRVSNRGRRVRPQLEALEDRIVPSEVLTVTSTADSGSGSLRAEIAAANSGDTINFDSSLAGKTIKLNSELAIAKSLTIENTTDGNVTVSGNHATRVFAIDAGVTAEIDDLTITHGLAALNGGGILNDGGILTLSHDVISDNEAQGGPGQSVSGGGIANINGATLIIEFSTLSNNKAVGGNGGSGNLIDAGNGGAISNNSSHLIVTDSIFTGNQALGGNSGVAGSGGVTNAGNAVGGAIRTSGPTGDATVTGSVFTNNQAIAGNSNIGTQTQGAALTLVGSSLGGAIAAVGSGLLKVSDSAFIGNEAQGGKDNSGGIAKRNYVGVAGGGAILVSTSPGQPTTGLATIENSTFIHNQAVGGEGSRLVGGGGSPGNINFIGIGAGGAIVGVDGGKPTVNDSTLFYNEAVGGGAGSDGGNGGDGLGGGIGIVAGGPPTSFNGSLNMSNDTLAFNQAVGGAGSPGHNGGNGFGGGVYSDAGSTDPSGTIIFDTKISTSLIIGNKAIGVDGGNGVGGGFYNASLTFPATLTHTIIAGNHASTSNPNIFGPVADPMTNPGTILIDALMSLLGNKDKHGA